MAQVEDIATHDGTPVRAVRLFSETGAFVDIMSWGVVVRDWQVPAPEGMRRVVLGFDDFESYPKRSPYFGAVVGRVANRIAQAQFTLDGEAFALEANEDGNCLHSGAASLALQNWTLVDAQADTARFRIVSPDGQGGFPGRVHLEATYRWVGPRLELTLEAWPDRPTPLSLIQHHYFNLGRSDTVLDHRLACPASAYTPLDDALLPTGAIAPVAGTRYDFRSGRSFRDGAGAPLDYDINLVLPSRRDPERPIAAITGEDEALTLRLWSDQPGLQVYNGVMLEGPLPGHGDRVYHKHSGFCLEDQALPDAVHHPHFPSIVATPKHPYRHWCAFEIE